MVETLVGQRLLHENTTVVESTGPLLVSRGAQAGVMYAQVPVNFAPEFEFIPVVSPCGGGLFGASGEYTRIAFVNFSPSGFTPFLDIVTPGGDFVPQSANFSGSVATKGTAGEAAGPSYEVEYNVTVGAATVGAGGFDNPTPSTVTILIETDDGSGYVQRKTVQYSNDTFSPITRNGEARTISVTGLGQGDTFRVTKLSETGNGGSVTPVVVRWTEVTGESTRDATANPHAPMYWIAVGGDGG